MFRQAAKKIAHNSTLPVLGGNKDLRTLQELITAEKAVLHSLQRLSTDIAKASEGLKAWGLGEGDDLGDTLSASCALYLHFADALQAFANHQGASIRTREERLDGLRRRRKALSSDADNAERKLSKMGPDHKNLQVQMDHFNKLRGEIRIMGTDIMAEEANLGDYKRVTAKAWLGIKFGGLLECCEKGIIISEHGKLVIFEIPIGRTEPGLPRAYYSGHAIRENLVTDARRALSTVGFTAEPNAGGRTYDGSDVTSLPPHNFNMGDISRRTSVIPAGDSSFPDSVSINGQMPRSPFTGSYGSMGPSSPSLSYTEGSLPLPPLPNPAEFGVVAQEPYSPRASSMRSPEERDRLMGPRGSRFSTLPALSKPRPPPGGRDSQIYAVGRPPSLDLQRPQDDFSTSIARALGDSFAFESREGTVGAERASGGSGEVPHSSPPPVYSFIARFDTEEGDVQLAYEDEGVRHHREDRKVKFEGLSNENTADSSQHAENEDDGRLSIRQLQSSPNQIPPVSDDDATSRIPSPPLASDPTPSPDQRALDAEAAREVSREIDELMSSPAMRSPLPDPSQRIPSPLVAPHAPFARRAVSPRPGADTSPPAPNSPRISTESGSQYMCEPGIDTSLATKRRRSHLGHTSAMPAISLHRPSPSTFSVNTNTNGYRVTPQSDYASPLSSPLPTPVVPFYTLPAASSSGKISAAAFRRQARSPNVPVPAVLSGSDASIVDTGPLMVTKRPLPVSFFFFFSF
ncbi:hypothetical protein C8Q72DRAFT_889146 [Fomitopsis betulina]|nr:hypothetical protein C8Q72DRAFT_889146 [Fomitopsis betulina]